MWPHSSTVGASAGGSLPPGEPFVPVDPPLSCDVVMKGGVTSGIVYPPAVVELAKAYRFSSIGGTSAGAIAAALTAAAEYRRRRGSAEGFFRHLAALPAALGAPGPRGKSKLFSLFQPDRSTRPIFNAIIGAIEGRTVLEKASAGLKGVFLVSPGITALAFVCWVILAVCAWYLASTGGPAWGGVWIGLLGFGFVGAAGGWLFFCLRDIARRVGNNAFGLCRGIGDPAKQASRGSGAPDDASAVGGAQPLTTWLADLIDEIAGRGDAGMPLTFGDLEGRGPGDTSVPEASAIRLRMMTTNLTHGRPYQLPFDSRAYYYDPSEMRRFFPERIVAWMDAHSEQYGLTVFRTLPDPADLPVVVAARLSLSFPLLVSAVPLYAVDWTLESNKRLRAAGALPELERCWFSDGGVCSNFPVHLFDGPIPSRPTFAINLRPFHPDHPPDPHDEANNVWMVKTNGEGNHEEWVRFEQRESALSVVHFLGRIVDTMQNWVDNTQLRVPGYRDRVAHISVQGHEGGLNLDMDAGLVGRLSARGGAAGAKLRDRFTGRDPGSALDWDNHRWVRYRSTMTLLERYLDGLRRVYSMPAVDGGSSYAELVRRREGEAPECYPWTRDSRGPMIEKDRALQGFIERWGDGEPRFAEGTPEPVPEFRIRPRL